MRFDSGFGRVRRRRDHRPRRGGHRAAPEARRGSATAPARPEEDQGEVGAWWEETQRGGSWLFKIPRVLMCVVLVFKGFETVSGGPQCVSGSHSDPFLWHIWQE